MIFQKIATFVLFLTNVSAVYAKKTYTQKNGTLFDKEGKEMHLKAISHFGAETGDRCPNGLWVHPLEFYMDLLEADNFNVIRVPFSSKLVLYEYEGYPDQQFVSADPANQNKKSMEILDAFFDMAYERNMLIMLDLHRLNGDYISTLWYSPEDGEYDSEKFLDVWFKMLQRYGNHKALWGIDLLNEPHDVAEWGTGNENYDWKMFAEYAIARIEEKFPEATWMYIVEGIGWGKDLSGVQYAPIELPASAKHRLCYSTHEYGKSVIPSLDIYNVQALRDDWDRNFGYLAGRESVITGEFGGRTDIDQEWMNHYVDYLKEKGMTDTFFWSLVRTHIYTYIHI